MSKNDFGALKVWIYCSLNLPLKIPIRMIRIKVTALCQDSSDFKLALAPFPWCAYSWCFAVVLWKTVTVIAVVEWLWPGFPFAHQYARVWLPDTAEVWKSAELIKDYTPGDLTLTLQLDDGTVGWQIPRTHTHIITHREIEALRWKWACGVLSESHAHISLQKYWQWSLINLCGYLRQL